MSVRTPTYRFHKATGQAVVTLNGRDVYLGKHGTPESRAAYDRAVAEWLVNGRATTHSEKLSISQLMVKYVRHAETYYVKDGKPTSEVVLIRLSLKPLKRLYGSEPAASFGPLSLKTVRQAFIESGLCRNEVNRRTRHIVRFFRWAVENELAPPSVHHGLRAVPGLKKGRCDVRESKPVRPVADAFVDAIQTHVSRQVWAMVELQRLTGMRPGEVCVMRSKDLDTSGAVWAYTPGRHKTEHHEIERRIFLGPRAQSILRPWLSTNLSAYLFSPKEAEEERIATMRANRKSKVQPSQRDRRKPGRARVFADLFDVGAYRTAIRRGCKKAGVPIWGPNRLRHNAATALRREHGIDVARVILGHSSPAVTETYAELDHAKAMSIMASVG